MKRALISVYDKKNIVDFARKLIELNWEIISTGGTYNLLKDEGLDIKEVSEVTSFPEILDGRVKTLHPKIHGGLLYERENSIHRETLKENNIQGIDMVVNNLYPFEGIMKKKKIDHDEAIENIDIGGPSMIRAAAKNYKDVIVIIDPNDYKFIIEELEKNNEISIEDKRKLAGKVFNYTSYYDSLIADYFNKSNNIKFPNVKTLAYKKKNSLRYGENPQQEAAFYEEILDIDGTLSDSVQLHGKELSYNNINDANGALKLLKEFEDPTIVAVKHSNPCGVGSGDTLYDAYIKAYECDEESIFGGIIGANRTIDKDVAEKINEIFIEIVFAPDFTEEALEILKNKKNIRILKIDNILKSNYDELDTKKVLGGLLVQEQDDILFLKELEIVTNRKPTDQEVKDLLFAWKVSKHINSNGIVIAKNRGTTGIGLGEVNRFWAVNKAIERTGDKINGAVIASDGFFPFKDSIETIGKSGIKAIIQPGGSIRDKEVIKEANDRDIAMIFTKTRHFKH